MIRTEGVMSEQEMLVLEGTLISKGYSKVDSHCSIAINQYKILQSTGDANSFGRTSSFHIEWFEG